MPSNVINAATAPDNYTAASTIDGGNWLEHFNLDVVNQPIYWSLKQVSGRQGENPRMAVWQPEVYMLPGSRSIYRRGLAGVRFRAAIPAASIPSGSMQAVVTLEAITF